MNNLENRLCEPKAWEILELAARYYTEQSQDYTVSELIQAGVEAQIPDRFIRQAIKDLKTKQQQIIQARKDYLQAINLEQKTIAAIIVNRSIDNFYRYAATNIKLQSSQLFINLQYEITGTENLIAVERMRYNQTVQKYNQAIDLFPQSLIAKLGRFEQL